jgi:hypothetical protein
VVAQTIEGGVPSTAVVVPPLPDVSASHISETWGSRLSSWDEAANSVNEQDQLKAVKAIWRRAEKQGLANIRTKVRKIAEFEKVSESSKALRSQRLNLAP